jgi:cell division protein ZapA
MPKFHTTEVEICGNTFTVRGEESPEYVQELAEYVEGEMQRITAKARVVSTTKVAILAALNIADELFKTQRKVEEKISGITERLKKELET